MLPTIDIQNLISPWAISIILAALSAYFCYLINRESNKRQQTEVLLEQERNYISTILYTASALVVRLDVQGKIVEFNRACEHTTGYLLSEVKGKYVWDVFTIAEEVEIFQSALAAVVTERLPITLETYWVTKTGDRRLISWTNTVLEDREGAVTHIISTGIDVSDRFAVEQSLKESEQKYRAVVNNCKQVIFQLDEWGLWTFLNPAWTEITGFSIDESLGNPFHKYIHPDDCAKCLHLFRSLMQHQIESCHCEIRYLGKDGRCIWIEVYGQLALDAYGNITGISGNLSDISDRKQAQEVMQRQLAAMEATIDGIGIVNSNGEYIYVNKAYVDIYGYDNPSELLGKTWREIYYPDEIARFDGDVRAIIQQNGRWRGEAIAKRKDGSTFCEELSLSLLEDGNLISICRNISDRKQIEVALQQSEARFKAFMNNSPVVAFIKDEQTRNIYINEPFERAFNIKAEDLRGKKDEEWIPEEAAQQMYEHDQIVLSTGQTIETIETIATPDGSSLYWLVYKFLIDDPQGQNLIGGVAIDITKRRQAEKQVKAALQEKDILLKEVHHRVKNNLQVIDSLFRHQCRHSDNQQVIQILKECQNRVVSMALLHEKLYQSKNLSNIDFAEYVKSLVGNLFDSYNVYVNELHLNINVEKIFLDFELSLNCGLIINELLTNSLKYAFPSGILGKIDIEFSFLSGNTYNLLIRDNGIGLPDNIDLQQVKTLGLKLVRSLVRQLDGKVEINSDRGTEFKITFPVRKCDINL